MLLNLNCLRASKIQEAIMDKDDAINVLEELIQTCKDGQKGYQEASSKVKRSDLRTFFNEQSLERARFAGELEVELIRLGKPDKKVSGSVVGSLHRAWVDTKVGLGGGIGLFWIGWRMAKTMPRMPTRRRSLVICRKISPRLCAGRLPACRPRMTR
jgi:Domain of unknown function (DUF2383)